MGGAKEVSLAVAWTAGETVDRAGHQAHVEFASAVLLLEGLGAAVATTEVELAVLAEDLLEARSHCLRYLLLALQFDLEAEVGHWHPLGLRPACALLVHLELHLVYLLDVVDRQRPRLRLRGRNGEGECWLIEEVIVYGGMVLAEFVFHVEEGVVVGVFGVAAVLGLAACALVDLVEDEVRGDGLGVVAVEAAAEGLLFGH